MSIFNYKIQALNVQNFFCGSFDQENNISLSFSVKFKFNDVERLIGCHTDYAYIQNGECIMSMSMDGIFSVSADTIDSLYNAGTITVPIDILQYIATICVGAARGEIHARAELSDSNVKNLILPPINLTECIKTSAVFRITNYSASNPNSQN